MIRLLKLLFLLSFCLLWSAAQTQNLSVKGSLVVKLKPQFSELLKNGIPEQLEHFKTRYNLESSLKVFSNSRGIVESKTRTDLIYYLNFNSNYPEEKLSKMLMNTDFFQYAEPRYIGELALQPNDPQFVNQNFLQVIGAEQAWDSTLSGTNVVVGLLDAGIDTNHEDLNGKFWLNTADPIDGVDNDNDGYLDNYLGWDFESNTGKVIYNSSTHGIQMAGAIAANTNNGKGIAGIGFNSLLLSVKVTDSNNEVVFGYEGIKYAADKGCAVINCSWNIKSYSSFGQDMVNYATLDKGSLVVAAIGNNGSDDQNYPAMFDNVLGVAAVDNNGYKVAMSNIHSKVSLSAPGLQILTTNANNSYQKNSGTSLSSAIVSGAAALLIAKRPSLSPQEIKSYLKATTTDIFQNGKNNQFVGKLGTGLLHIGDAMAYDGSGFPEFNSFEITEANNGVVESGDTVEIEVLISNYLKPTGKVDAILSSNNSYSVLLDSISSWTMIANNDTVSNSTQKFRVALNSSIPQNQLLDFSLTLIEGGDTNNYSIEFSANTAYREIITSKISTSLGNRGTFGWYRYSQKQGNGFTYKNGAQLLYEGGLMVGTKNGTVVDRIRGFQDVEQKDFTTSESLQEITVSKIPFALSGSFSDTVTGVNEIGISINQKAYAWPGEASRENFVIFEYTIKSAYNLDLNDIYVGLLADWDIEDFDKNRANYDGFRFLAYTHSTENKGPYCGVQLLSLEDKNRAYSIDNINGGAGGIDITDNDVFSKSEKLLSISSNRYEAGKQAGGNDVLQIISSGEHDIKAGDSLVFRVAVLVADDLTELQSVADTAFWLVNNRLPNNIESQTIQSQIKVYPNPSNNLFNVSFDKEISAKIELINLFGETVRESEVENQKQVEIKTTGLARGIYFLEINIGGEVYTHKVVKN
ncbi:MAG: S8 family serine peptidase [Salibacteraceae bacterium]